MSNEDLIQAIEHAEFTPVRLREGYDMAEVDHILDRLIDVLRGDGSVDELISTARFTPTRLREGYDIAEVDSFLESVRRGSPIVRRSTAPTPAAGPVIEEQRGPISRLFRRG